MICSHCKARWDQWAEVLSSESGLSSRIIMYDQLQMSAAVRHGDTHQSASPWCFRETEGGGAADMMLGDTTHLLPSGWPGWPMCPAGSRRLLLPLKPISLVSPSLSREQHRQKKIKIKNKQLVKSSWSLQTVRAAGSDHNSLCSIWTSSDHHRDHRTPPTATTRSP